MKYLLMNIFRIEDFRPQNMLNRTPLFGNNTSSTVAILNMRMIVMKLDYAATS
jgi:hypothetical protein